MFRRAVVSAFVALVSLCMCAAPADARNQWTKVEANRWYAAQRWPVGSNYIPANAINQLEMWQADTFDPATIDKELGWAEQLHMTTMRVFLHNLLWEQDAAGFKQRIDKFLTIANKHHIKPVFVLFDSCWDPNPKLGPQHPPIPGVHNSGWVQAPGAARLADRSQYGKLEQYVKDTVGSFAKDSRILAWDVWNEPDNVGGNSTNILERKKLIANLLDQAFTWAEDANPTQPLTSGVWSGGPWNDSRALNPVERIQLQRSDIMSFHNYGWPEEFAARAHQMLTYGRPVICTEFMARGAGSTFDGSLPIGKRLNVGMINWGFVDGKTQTRFPWDSWKRPYTSDEPIVWFHDVLHSDGTPYRTAETDLIKRLATAPKGIVPELVEP